MNAVDLEQKVRELEDRLARLEAPRWFAWMFRAPEGGQIVHWVTQNLATKADVQSLRSDLATKVDVQSLRNDLSVLQVSIERIIKHLNIAPQ